MGGLAVFTRPTSRARFLRAAAELCWLRSEMEDALHMSLGTYFFGVFDGHGGDKCSANAATAFPKEVLSLRLSKPPRWLLLRTKVDTLACQKTSDECCAALRGPDRPNALEKARVEELRPRVGLSPRPGVGLRPRKR